jgi:hypothetical protein
MRCNKKPSPWGRGGFLELVRRLGSDDVCRLKTFGAFEQIKLHGLTFIQRAVTVLLDRGEVHEHIFPRGALDESISFRPVEPLHCTFLSHGKTPFTIAKNVLQLPGFRLGHPKPPSEKQQNFRLRLYVQREFISKKEKTPQLPNTMSVVREPSGVRQFGASFHYSQQTSTTYWSHHRTKVRFRATDHTSIKTFRKGN